MEKEQKTESRYLISRDDSKIKWDSEQLEARAKDLNDLCKYMRLHSGFPLETVDQVKDCISKGPTLFIKGSTIARTDKESLKKLYGFEADREALLSMVPVGHVKALDVAEKYAAALRDESLEDFNFDTLFSVKPAALRRITAEHTRYASKKEAELHKRIDAIVADIDAIKDEYGFNALTVHESFSRGYLHTSFSKNTEGITIACKQK